MGTSTQPIRLETKNILPLSTNVFSLLKKLVFPPPPEKFGGRRENARTAKAKRTELEINKKTRGFEKTDATDYKLPEVT